MSAAPANPTPPAGRTFFIATNIQDAFGNPLAAGTLSILPTDANDQPIPTVGGGGANLTRYAVVSVFNGAIVQPSGSTLSVPDSELTRPGPHLLPHRGGRSRRRGSAAVHRRPPSPAQPSISTASSRPVRRRRRTSWVPQVYRVRWVPIGPSGTLTLSGSVPGVLKVGNPDTNRQSQPGPPPSSSAAT